jgi:DNA-binding transcriptional MerR regulator
MFKIGVFSRISQVPVATLRFYDEVGLLKPMRLDSFTGYRYYAADQLARLNRILALKDLGFSLEQIAHLLDEDLPTAQLRGMLRLKRMELQQRLQDEQARLARVEARLRQIELEESMPTHEIVLKHVDPLTVARVCTVVPAHRNVSWLFDELRAYLTQHGVTPTGPAIAIWHDRHPMLEAEAAMPIATAAVAAPWVNGRVTVQELPAAEMMASTVHHGSPGTLAHAYAALQTWIGANGYMLCGPYREVLVQPGSTPEDQSAVIELQVPIARDARMEPAKAILAPEELAQLSERSKQVLERATAEAWACHQAYLGTEHLLLGLIGVEQGFAGYVLHTFGVTLPEARKVVETAAGSDAELPQRQELNNRLQQVFTYALEEVKQRNQDYIGTEHLLLGLLRERDGAGRRVLSQLGVAPDQVRKEVEQLLQQQERT